MKPETEVITQSIKQKIQIKIIPAVIILSALSFLVAGAFSFFLKAKLQSPQTPLATPVFQTQEKRKYVPGQLLVKFKTGVDVQKIIVEKTKDPQALYFDKKTNTKIERVTPEIIYDLQSYTQKKIAIGFKDAKPIFSSPHLTKASIEKLSKRKIKEPQKKARNIGLDRWQRITVNPEVSILELSRQFATDPGVEAAEPDYLSDVQPSKLPLKLPADGGGGGSGNIPNDPYFSSSGSWGQSYSDMWGLKRIGLPAGWSNTTGSSNVVVAVSDTGIDYNHPDIQGRIWQNTGEIPGNEIDDDSNGYIDDQRGWDFGDGDNNPMDYFGHGTHVAGTIGAATNNALGVVGINWNIQLMPVKGFSDGAGSGSNNALANTITYAADNGADVINMSWGGYGKARVVEDAITYAYSQGVILVAAAGNDYADASNFYPAALPHILTVAAWDGRVLPGNPASFSNYGDVVDLLAPGVEILSLRGSGTDMYLGANGYVPGSRIVPTCLDSSGNQNACPSNYYYRANGTSMAAPHVAGAVALLLAYNPSFSAELTELILDSTAENVLNHPPYPGKDEYGYGLLNINSALQFAQNATSNPHPELLISEATTSMFTPEAGQLVVTVKNAGLQSSELNVLKVFRGPVENGDIAGRYDIPDLNPRDANTATIPFSISGSASTFLTVQIDADNSVSEYFETNNSAQVPVTAPQLPGWPKIVGGITGSPGIADLDPSYPGLETVIGSWNNYVYAWHADGTSVAGWPKQTDNYVMSAPTIADIDGDDALDVVIGSGGSAGTNGSMIYAWHADGTSVAGWPKSITSPQRKGGAPAIADIDGDGKPEVVVVSSAGPATFGQIYIWRQSATNPVVWEDYPGWPKTLYYGGYVAAPVLADLDPTYQGLEIIMATEDPWEDDRGNRYYGTIYAWHVDGTNVSGWPLYVKINGGAQPPAVADIDGDDHLEVVIGDALQYYAWHVDGSLVAGWPQPISSNYSGASTAVAELDPSYPGLEVIGTSRNAYDNIGNDTVYVWHADGTPMSGWPKNINPDHSIPLYSEYSSPGIADLDGDGALDIVIGNSAGGVDAFRSDGTPLPGWPIPTSWVLGSPAVADLNADGRLEVVVGSLDGRVYAWTMPTSSTTSAAPWPTFHHDNQRTGRYDAQAPTVVISSPLANATISGSSVNIVAAVADNSNISKVQFFADTISSGFGTQVCTSSSVGQSCTSTYSLDSTKLSKGNHVLRATAFDNYGNVGTSITVTVKVDNSSGGGGGPRKLPI